MLRKLLGPVTAVFPRRRRTVIVSTLSVLLAGTALALAGGTAGKTPIHGLVRASNSATGESASGSVSNTTSFGPTVYTGIYQGESPPVASLPVLPVNPGPLQAREIELLRSGGASDAHDTVVQHQKGTGPLSAPIQNFDGICLPFGPPCAQQSSCSCLPPDTDGEVGASQYVQMVNTDFAVYSKTGGVLRTATPINELWANTDGECKTHNDGDPVVVYDQLARRWLLSQFIATPDTGSSTASASRSRPRATPPAATTCTSSSSARTLSTTIRRSASGPTATT